jgi:hypothetical protein
VLTDPAVDVTDPADRAAADRLVEVIRDLIDEAALSLEDHRRP